jgi:hypothetical protein
MSLRTVADGIATLSSLHNTQNTLALRAGRALACCALFDSTLPGPAREWVRRAETDNAARTPREAAAAKTLGPTRQSVRLSPGDRLRVGAFHTTVVHSSLHRGGKYGTTAIVTSTKPAHERAGERAAGPMQGRPSEVRALGSRSELFRPLAATATAPPDVAARSFVPKWLPG